jgi:hypothetical protein
MAVRLSAAQDIRAPHQNNLLVLISVRVRVNLRATVRLEGLGKLVKSYDLTGTRTPGLPASDNQPHLLAYPQMKFLFNIVPPKLLLYNSSYTQYIRTKTNSGALSPQANYTD